MIVTPARLMSSIFWKIASTNAGARPAEGSSSKSTWGSGIRARAIATIWRSPPLIVPAVWLRRSPSRGKSSYIRSICAPVRSRSREPISRFSSTVRLGNTLSSCGT
jgi:hypothetical protein